MEFLSAVDQLTKNHSAYSVLALFGLVVWVVAKKYILNRSFVEAYPGIVATVDLIAFPVAIMCAGGLLYFALQAAHFSKLETQVQFVIHLVAMLSIAWCLARLVENIILSRSNRLDTANYLPGIQRGLLFGGALFFGLITFLNIRGYSITGLYVSTGAVAALIAFGMQRTLGDLFSGIALSIEHPFRIGDWIELADGSQGQIIDINWRATRFRTWDKGTLVVPNSELAQQGIKNLHGSDHVYAPWYEVKISGDVDPRFARALLLEAALRCDRILKNPLPSVRLADGSSIPYTYMIWVHFKNFPSMFAGREELFREIHYGLKEAGIQVATKDVHEIHTRSVEMITVEPPTTLLALKGLDIANVFNDDELEQMASMSQRYTFEAGTVLLPEGNVADAFDIIIAGIVESSVMTKSGSSRTIDQFKPGQYFGITSMITDDPSFLQFTALTDVTLVRVELNCFRATLNKRPELSNALAKIVKQRLEVVEDTRQIDSKPTPKLTLQDILKRIDTFLH